jgi:oligopeptide/dipeptide ABC transporter ATP-binding protein
MHATPIEAGTGAGPRANARAMEPVLSVEDLKTWFYTPAGVARAVDGVSFDVYPRDILAIVGESGSGKSVTALSLLKLVPTPPGRYVDGRVMIGRSNVLDLNERRLQEVRGGMVGMIFQNPRGSLDPCFTIRSHLFETLSRHQPELDKERMRQRATAALREVGFLDTEGVLASYPHQLSGGMCQRVALAMALACRPSLLIADEPTTALDVGVQAKILLLLKRKNRELGLPIIIITHDFGVVRAVATRVIVMYAGQVQEEGPVDEILENPRHPYTQALIRSVPDPDASTDRLQQIGGEPPNLLMPPPGCRFHPRCSEAFGRCASESPPLHRLQEQRSSRCHLHDSVNPHREEGPRWLAS